MRSTTPIAQPATRTSTPLLESLEGLPAPTPGRRRLGMRVHTDFPVVVHDGNLESHCRAIEVSPVGVLLDRGHEVTQRDDRILLTLELMLPERARPIYALVRPVRSEGSLQAMHIVEMSDADQLSLAEHIDLKFLQGMHAA